MELTQKFSDLDLSFIPHPLTGNLNPKKDKDSIKQSLRILFSLNTFDLPFNMISLMNVKKYLFEDLNHITASNISVRIETAIRTFEKRIEFISAKVEPLSTFDGINITVTYRIKTLNIEDVFNQQFQRVR